MINCVIRNSYYGTVGSTEAKTHLSTLLNKVAGGETITITKRGVPVAILVPPAFLSKPDVQTVIEEIKTFRKGRKLGKLTLQAMIEEGRK